jgi:valyl-tRNA synthetase
MEYDYFTVTSSLQSFFWNDFCDNYLELVKHRIYGEDEKSKRAAQYTLKKVLESSIKLMAPIISFTTEEIHNKIFNENETIHLQEFPKSKKELIDEHSEKTGDLLCEIMSHVRKHKSTNRISLKEEVDKLKISIPRDKIILVEALRKDVEQVGHIKQLEFEEGESLGVIN